MKTKIFFVYTLFVLFMVVISCKTAPDNTSDKKKELKPGVVSEDNTSTAPAAPAIPAVSAAPSTPATSSATPTTPVNPVIPSTPATSAAPAIPVSTEILTGHIGKADAARKRAVDFTGPDYFPSEWDAADSMYAVAANMTKTTQSDVQQAAVIYDNSADAYDDIFRKTIPLYAQAREDEIMAAREKLINAGIKNYFPDYLKEADNKALLALSQYETGDYYSARDTAADALNDYETLYTGAKILQVRREIIDRGFVKYDADNFKKADEAALAVNDEYKTGNKKTAAADAENVLRRYNNILANGWKAYAGEKRAAAVSQKEQALDEKTNVASRDLFREADGIFNRAEQSFASQNYQNAAVSYADSEERFLLSRLDTEEKRRKALDIIRQAEEKIEESNETAIDAERVIEGGTK